MLFLVADVFGKVISVSSVVEVNAKARVLTKKSFNILSECILFCVRGPRLTNTHITDRIVEILTGVSDY